MSPAQKPRWRLSTIINSMLLALYLVGSIFLIVLVNSHIKQQALNNAQRFSSLILDRNLITHAYFTNVLKTSLLELFDENLLDTDWMSTTFAINSITEDYALFTEEGLYYKEAAINARNPANEADSYEHAFIKQINSDQDLLTVSEIRNYNNEPFLTILRRGQQVEAKCLLCHGDPDDAPSSIVERYGAERGFHRQLGQTVSAISIRIPLAIAYQEADSFSVKLSAFLLAVLLVIFAVHYTVSRKLLFKPIATLQESAHQVATDPDKLGETLPIPIGRELASMVETFNHMSQNLRHYSDDQEDIIRERTRELAQLQHRNETILNTASEGILGLSDDGHITFINQSAKAMLGLQESEIGQVRIFDLVLEETPEPDHPDPEELLNGVLQRGAHVSQQEALLTHHTGRNFPIEFSCAPIIGNGISGAVFSFNDITQRKLSEKEIQNLAFYDQLTRLPNRTLFYDRITQRVAAAERDKQKLALMFLDLDDFKMVNDTLGHAAGDEFLKVIAQRLREGSRQADTVARMGGDEFVWFGEIIDADDARLIARKFIEGLSRPVRLGQHNFVSTVSIGIAIYPDVATDIVGLMKCADTAMYRVKQKSKNDFAFSKVDRKS